MSSAGSFKLTCASMFHPPDELYSSYADILARIKNNLGEEQGMIVAGKDHLAREKYEKRSPINTNTVPGIFQKGDAGDVRLAIEAGKKAFPAWSGIKWQRRVELLRKAADLVASESMSSGRSPRWKSARTAWKLWATTLRWPT